MLFDLDNINSSAYSYAKGDDDIDTVIKEQFDKVDDIRLRTAGEFSVVHENLMYFDTKFEILKSFLMTKRIAKNENFEKDINILISEYEKTIQEFRAVYNQLCDILKNEGGINK